MSRARQVANFDPALFAADEVSGDKVSSGTIGGNTIIDTSGAITTTGTATFSGDLVPATPLSHRNLWINGAMMVSQRYGTSAGTGTHPYFGLDRYKVHYSGGPVISSQQVTDVPASPLDSFVNSMKMTITTNDATSGTDQCYVKYPMEGIDTAQLRFGSTGAKTTTLSFYVKSSVAGIYSISYKNEAGNRSYTKKYTITSADTWERIELTIPGDTTGTWMKGTPDIGLAITFNLGSGSSREQAEGSWGTGNVDGASGSTGSDTWVNTSGATFYITGIQLEEGSNATPFEHRSFGDELARCERYYWRWTSAAYPYGAFCMGQGYSSTEVNGVRDFPTTMRAAPSFAVSSASNFWWSSGTGNTALTSIAQWGASVHTSLLIIGVSSSTAGYIRAGATTSAYVEYTAEL